MMKIVIALSLYDDDNGRHLIFLLLLCHNALSFPFSFSPAAPPPAVPSGVMVVVVDMCWLAPTHGVWQYRGGSHRDRWGGKGEKGLRFWCRLLRPLGYQHPHSFSTGVVSIPLLWEWVGIHAHVV